MRSLMKSHPILAVGNSTLIELPAPQNLYYWWNFGSLAFCCLFIQILTGFFLSMHYCSDIQLSFSSVIHIMQDVSGGWLIRFVHMNGASLFFFCLYLHVGRGLYYISWSKHMTWSAGVGIILCLMATSFLGYVLPWGQMSFWGATVITNLGSAIPVIGLDLVEWLWGGFSVGNATLTRFYSLHFLLPFVILALVGVHILFLHGETSSNPLGLSSSSEKVSFHPYYTIKDIFGVVVLMSFFALVVCQFPLVLGDSENFMKANSLVTPVHIQPEWYFLFAYAILRSIPSKLGGVIALAMAVLILIFLPLMELPKFKGNQFYLLNQLYFWSLVSIFALLTWIGMCPVESPYLEVGQLASIYYFSYFLLNSKLYIFLDKLS